MFSAPVFPTENKFLRSGECSKRARAKCITFPDADLELIKSAVWCFFCNTCNTASSLSAPASDYGPSSAAAASLAFSSNPSHTATTTQPIDLGAELLSLRALLVDTMKGISFFSDQVTKLG